jgi:pimeloyl-ACP methyl ester carboxylesterase
MSDAATGRTRAGAAPGARLELRARDGSVSGLLARPDGADESRLLVFIHGGGSNSGYFDLPRRSALKAALARGKPVLLVNRPGHGGNPGPASDRPIRDQVPAIETFIGEVLTAHFPRAQVAIVGHSIGGAIALMLAALRPEWPLTRIAISGIGDEPTPPVRDWWSQPDAEVFPPESAAVSLFLGPEGTYDWQAPIALRRASEPWLQKEVAEIVRSWPLDWPQVAPQVTLPVHLRLAEHDNIWCASEAVARRMADRLSGSPLVDAAILPEGGHLYEIHKRGGELIESQLDFVTEADPAGAADIDAQAAR